MKRKSILIKILIIPKTGFRKEKSIVWQRNHQDSRIRKLLKHVRPSAAPKTKKCHFATCGRRLIDVSSKTQKANRIILDLVNCSDVNERFFGFHHMFIVEAMRFSCPLSLLGPVPPPKQHESAISGMKETNLWIIKVRTVYVRPFVRWPFFQRFLRATVLPRAYILCMKCTARNSGQGLRPSRCRQYTVYIVTWFSIQQCLFMIVFLNNRTVATLQDTAIYTRWRLRHVRLYE